MPGLCGFTPFEFGPFAPLIAVNRAEFAGFVRPGVPDGGVLSKVVIDICRAFQEPEQFMQYRVEEDFFSCQKRKALTQVVFSLQAENRNCACAGAIGFEFAVFEDFADEREVLLHVVELGCLVGLFG